MWLCYIQTSGVVDEADDNVLLGFKDRKTEDASDEY